MRAATIAKAQGVFWLAAGLWPLVHLPSLEAVTGRKKEKWLVRSIASLMTVVGASLLLAGRRGREGVGRETVAVGVGAALALGTADVVYTACGRIAKTYLFDAVAQAAILCGWAATYSRKPRRDSRELEEGRIEYPLSDGLGL
jgi:hypothetical protein